MKILWTKNMLAAVEDGYRRDLPDSVIARELRRQFGITPTVDVVKKKRQQHGWLKRARNKPRTDRLESKRLKYHAGKNIYAPWDLQVNCALRRMPMRLDADAEPAGGE